MSDFMDEEVRGQLMPYADDPGDATLTIDQPAMRARHHTDQTSFIFVQFLHISEEIKTCRSIVAAVPWIKLIVIIEHLQKTSL
jgi:hypothetical protein